METIRVRDFKVSPDPCGMGRHIGTFYQVYNVKNANGNPVFYAKITSNNMLNVRYGYLADTDEGEIFTLINNDDIVVIDDRKIYICNDIIKC